MIEFSSMQVSLWVNKRNPSFKEALNPHGLSCASHIHQIKVDEPLLRVAYEFWIPSCHVFQFNGIELCPTTKEFGAIMSESDFGSIILSTLEEDLSELAHQVLEVNLSIAKKSCKPRMFKIFVVFNYFLKKALPLMGTGLTFNFVAGFFLVYGSH